MVGVTIFLTILKLKLLVLQNNRMKVKLNTYKIIATATTYVNY